ncbi:UNVERIFIED_CONTAM: hypothetical protein FKN15_011428 [Acipenser sinensis]
MGHTRKLNHATQKDTKTTVWDQVLRESKSLVRNAMKGALEQANEKECEVLKRVWGSAQGMDSILKYLQKKIDEF